MKIVIIGSGNVATKFGELLKRKNNEIVQIIGRNKTEVKKLSKKFNALAEINFQNILLNADLYIIAVNDSAVEEISRHIFLKEKLVVHTAGSVSVDVLKRVSKNYGVFYPLQSIRSKIKNLPEIPLLIDGNSEKTKNKLFHFGKTISNNVSFANDETRFKLHLGAVIVSNFSNHLFTLTKDFCKKEKIDFNLLLPIINETINRLEKYKPAEMQTGPAIRKDKKTIKKHLKLIENQIYLSKIYELMSKSIEEYYK